MIIFVYRGIRQTDNPKTVLSAQCVYGGGGKFKVYKNAMGIKSKVIYHSTTSFHRRQKVYKRTFRLRHTRADFDLSF